MGERKDFFSISINLNREEAEEKLAEYRGLARPTLGDRLDDVCRHARDGEVTERTPFQRRARWVLIRVIKLLTAVFVPILAIAVCFGAMQSDRLRKGEFEHHLVLKDLQVHASSMTQNGEMAVKVTSADAIKAIYERGSDGRWSMKVPSDVICSRHKGLLTTKYGRIEAYSGAEAGVMTLFASPENGPQVGYTVDGLGNLVLLTGEAMKAPTHDHSFSYENAEATIHISEEGAVLLENDPISTDPRFYEIDETDGFSEIDTEAAMGPVLEQWDWGSGPSAEVSIDGDSIEVRWRKAETGKKNWATINTCSASYRDFEWSRGASQDGEASSSSAATFDDSGFELALSVATLIMLLLFFRRDVRLLARHLGKPMRVGRALLTSTSAAIGARIVYILVIFSIIIPNTIYHEGTEPTRLVVPKFLEAPDEVRQVKEARANSQFGALLSIGFAPVIEEIVFRCVLFLILLRIFGKFWSVVITTALFVLAHESTYTLAPIIVIIIGSMGLFMALVLVWTRRLRWAILCHAFSNAVVYTLWKMGY